MRHRRATSLLTTLCWLALIASLGFGLARLSMQHVSALTYQENRQQALNLARSAVSMAIERLVVDSGFGKDVPGGLLTVQLPGTREGSQGLLTFEATQAQAQGIGCSVNNLKGTAPVTSPGGTVVPLAAALLIGEGRSGGVTQRVQAVVAVPAFPYALAATGPIQALGGVSLGALKAPPADDTPLADNVTLGPSDLLSNDSGAQAVFLGPGTRIRGDVRASGQIVLDPGAPTGSIQVDGQLKSRAEREKIPQVDVTSYDPAGQGAYTPIGSPLTGSSPLTGIVRSNGSLNVVGGLELDGCLLYVDGNLTVQGGLRGKGMLVATGNITLSGQSGLVAGNKVAILAGGDVSVSGSGHAGSYFQGLVYTEGSLLADRVTVVGGLIASRNPKPVTLNDSRVLTVPGQSVTVEAPTTQSSSPPSGAIFMIPLSTSGAPGLYKLSFTTDPAGATTAKMSPSTPGFPILVPPGGNLEFAVRQALSSATYQGKTLFRSEAVTSAIMNMRMQSHSGGQSSGSGGTTTTTQVAMFDPSSFLSLQEKYRVVMWREQE